MYFLCFQYAITNNYIASSASVQEVPNPALWLATRADKMAVSCQLGITRCVPHENSAVLAYNEFFVDQACSVKTAGYWPCPFFACLYPSRSINTQETNLANTQPSWPQAWSITHIYFLICMGSRGLLSDNCTCLFHIRLFLDHFSNLPLNYTCSFENNNAPTLPHHHPLRKYFVMDLSKMLTIKISVFCGQH